MEKIMVGRKNTRVIVTRYGGPEVLEVIDEECPEPKRGEVRVKVLAAGVSAPDIMAREGIHPETPRAPFTPGWDLVGVVDKVGPNVSGTQPGQTVASMPIHGSYTEFICLPEQKLTPVPPGLDSAEAVSVILNYMTAYQMLHRSAKVKVGQSILIHGASGGVGTALLQLGRLAGLTMYGTCSARAAAAVTELGGTPIDYKNQDFVNEIFRLTGEGVDAVFEAIGGSHAWRSRKALKRGGKVVAYGLTGSLQGGRSASGKSEGRDRFRVVRDYAPYIMASWLWPGWKHVVPYSIQTLMRLKPDIFRRDLLELFHLLQQKKINPVIAHRLALSEVRRAHELLGQGGVIGKIVLLPRQSSL